ncbi:family 16 glycosylhydrolase [Streptomyces sp. H39-S7]|uniref:family 16 glycosylhydrolase n=1 Tax=Streptomyces sp. H39-S7 TaxID=3004357 RepID=UPI0022B04A0B|nr:family 16 glycosylhydrolase [Streptomyces sp. H39-S7]MCZ4120234.1 family 16 glycosylhydrolase [Streptomyces sp. H39-S7]
MNIHSLHGLSAPLRYYARYRTRRLALRRRSTAFSSYPATTAIERIYVINLDRAKERWSAVNRELKRLREAAGNRLHTLARRFPAVDARYLQGPPPPELLEPTYTLAEQLQVDPHPHLAIDDAAHAIRIDMTPQEIAVALSHIHVWQLIAAGDAPYTLVLEDDAYVTRTCLSVLEHAWSDIQASSDAGRPVDLLYLSYQETGEQAPPRRRKEAPLRRPTGGVWQLSGYVLSQAGARKLLDQLPAHGPIDLWINQQFCHLHVRMTHRPVIEQRPGIASSNSYSVMPILAKMGALRREAPQTLKHRPTRDPILVIGEPGTGLSTLATALSVLGLRCVSDLSTLPAPEHQALVRGSRHRIFDAYVNIGSLTPREVARIVSSTRARLIMTSTTTTQPPPFQEAWDQQRPQRQLLLAADDPDPWQTLARFLACDYPTHPWPRRPEQGQRHVITRSRDEESTSSTSGHPMTWDTSPWIVQHVGWSGIMPKTSTPQDTALRACPPASTWHEGTRLEDRYWYLREDTFPSNRVLFRPDNAALPPRGPATLTLKEEPTAVRDLTGAAIASRSSFTYGTFNARLRVPCGPGLVTGLFLHRNGPRQEIDIEILGQDTTRMLVNVFYNPGAPGTTLEYGYRGTPTVIDLGFDAAKTFHHYEIDWQPDSIRWRVDGVTVHERAVWDPTPIPDQPLEFNVNLWSSQSTEFAGPLDRQTLPAVLEIASLEAHGLSPA